MLLTDNIVIGNSRISGSSASQGPEIKTETEIDLMEIDSIC